MVRRLEDNHITPLWGAPGTLVVFSNNIHCVLLFFLSFNLLKSMLDLKSEDAGSSLALGLSKCALYLEHVTLSL